MDPVPNHPTTYSLAYHPHCPSPHIMSTSKPWTVDDTFPDVKSRPVTTAALNADIRTLTATKGTLEIVPANAVFESVIGILCFVRVRVSVLAPLFCSFLSDIVRTR